VLKQLSLVLQRHLPSSKLCTHLKGHGGIKQTVTSIQDEIPNNTFVFRTDVKSYYESINHEILLDKLSVYIIVLSPTRWKLRKAIKTVNQHFETLKLKQHPDKTDIGRISNGFDFLGYQFGQEKITVSKRTLQNYIRRLSQLYEQKKHLPNWKILLDDYRQHWFTSVYSGIPSSIINFDYESVELRLFLKST